MTATRVNDFRDVDNTTIINDTAYRYAELILTRLWDVVGELYPLFIRPVGNGVGGFFRGENGHYSLIQPFVNIAMIPGNAGMVIVDGVGPLHPNGGFGLPTAPIFGRLAQTVQLLGDIKPSASPAEFDRKQKHKLHLKSPVAAAVASTLAVYIGLQAMSIANGLLVSDQRLAATLTLNPVQIVQTLLQGDPTLYQKLMIGLAGYIGATNGFVRGKELVLNDLQSWWHGLWADVRKDNLLRHLTSLEKIASPEAAKAAQDQYLATVANGRDWAIVDLTGRSLERVLSIPSQILSLPSNNTRHVTLPKAWLKNNSYMQGGAEALRVGGDYISQYTPAVVKQSASFIVALLGWDNQRAALPAAHFPTAAALLERKKRELWGFPTSWTNLFSNEARRADVLESKLNLILIEKYTQDIYNFKMGIPLTEPVMPTQETYLPFPLNWNTQATQNIEIIKMLKGEFPVANAKLHEKARMYNEALYSVYTTGQYEPEAPALRPGISN